MISSFAWKNLWRNKLRSSIIILAITLGIFAAIFVIAFANGMVSNRINSIVLTELSHIQIHQEGFLDNDQINLRISGADSVVNILKKMPHVVAVSKRIVLNSLAASAETSVGVKIIGVDFDDERKVSNVSGRIIEGKYLGETGKNQIFIGEKLAQKLNVGLNNKIIITVQDINKNITAGAFRVVGIFRTDYVNFDESNLYIRNKDISTLTGLDPNDAHEIAILLDKNENTEVCTKNIAGLFPKLDVENWQQISPEAGYLANVMNQYTYIFIFIILLALCFGIINTMLMVVLERVHELGMLMAIGMNRFRLFVMIVQETVFLSLTGGVFGIIIGYLVSNYFGRVGINLNMWKDAFAELGYSSIIYPVMDNSTMIGTTIMVIFAGVFSAMYPAYKALKLNPCEAIRTE